MQHLTPMVLDRFADESAVIAVVGLGKIGLPLAVQYARRGRHVIGCDSNSHVVETINAGGSHVHEEAGLDAAVADAVATGALSATLDTRSAVCAADVVVVIVPVMITDEHEIDFRAIDMASETIGKGLAPGKLVLYETTLPVGTTAGRLRSILESSSQLEAGRDFYLAYSPERVSSGHIFHDLARYPKVVGGIDDTSAEAAGLFYSSVLDAEVLRVASANHAEFVKLIETTYRDVNIALANEFAKYGDRRGLDVNAAIHAANTQPYSHIHSPGVGVGGHCIPVYPYFLLADADSAGNELSLPRQARIVNDQMAEYTTQRIESVVGALAERSVVILGAAYRGNVREPAFSSTRNLHGSLLARGAQVTVFDPLFSDAELRMMGYTPFTFERAEEVSALILQADHRAYHKVDWGRFTSCRVLLDGRRAFRPETFEALGIQYIAIGDGGQAAVESDTEIHSIRE